LSGFLSGRFPVSSIAANKLARICAYSTYAPEWEQFVHAVTPVVALAARRVSLVWGDSSAHAISEIVQEVFLKLVEDDRRILREFEDRGNEAFLKLLRMVAASVATDYHRRAQADKRGGRMGAVSLKAAETQQNIFDGRATHAVEWPALMAQLDGLLRMYPESVSDRDRQIFWLYYRQGLTAQAIARIPAVELTAKGVESALRRMAQLLRNTILQGKPAGAGAAEAEVSSPPEAQFSPVIAIHHGEQQ
jgi:RNA polymerase sigma-70 factor (ECF subfamily)